MSGKRRRYICFHDLRHTFASHWMMKGGDIYKLKAILGHSTVDVTERYAHLSPDRFAEDHGRFGDGPSTQDGKLLQFKEENATTSATVESD